MAYQKNRPFGLKDNSLTTILRKIYCPLYTQIMDELLIMTDYKQCSFVVF